jgi:hypothetical protein
MGAGTSLWAERQLRRSVQQAAARLHPDALVAEVGRTARQAAESTGERVRGALSSGRDEMQRREEELWADLAAHGVDWDGFPDGRSDRFPDGRSDRDSGDRSDRSDSRSDRDRVDGSTLLRRRERGARRVAPTSGDSRRSPKPPLHLGK